MENKWVQSNLSKAIPLVKRFVFMLTDRLLCPERKWIPNHEFKGLLPYAFRQGVGRLPPN
jgi:hypothetical protein